jgi:two-component sensor histidine kinase
MTNDQELQIALQNKDVLFAELEHRSRNTLQMISAFLAMAANSAKHPETKSALRDVRRRVESVDAAERALLKLAADDRVDLAEFLPEVVKELMVLETRPGLRFEMAVEPVETTVRQASSLGMIVNELTLNAMKHAYPAGGGGRSAWRCAGSATCERRSLSPMRGSARPRRPRGRAGAAWGGGSWTGFVGQMAANLEICSGGGTRAVLEFDA